MTTLSPELQQAAQDFGLALRQHESVQQYLQAVANLTADPEAQALDEQFETIRADLVARQRAGEDLPSDERGTGVLRLAHGRNRQSAH